MNRSFVFAAAAVVLCGCHLSQNRAHQAATPTPSQANAAPAAETATIPAELHFSPSDVAYLQSVDATTREAALRRRRDDIEALQRVARLSQGYTGSLKQWSISTRTSPVTGAKR